MTIHRQNFIHSNSNSYTNLSSLESTPLNSLQSSLNTHTLSSTSIDSLVHSSNNYSNSNQNAHTVSGNSNSNSNSVTNIPSLLSFDSMIRIGSTPNFVPLEMLNNEIGENLLNDWELENDDLNKQYIVEDIISTLQNGPTQIEDHFERSQLSPTTFNLSLKRTISHKADKWFVCLVGLPASGKSTIVKQLKQYIMASTNDKIRVEIFNAGAVRREHEKREAEGTLNNKNSTNHDNLTSSPSMDFAPNSSELRDTYCFEALDNLTNSLINDECDIGILDATNTTRARRSKVIQKVNELSKRSNIIIKPLIFEVKILNKSLRRFNIEKKKNIQDYEKFSNSSEKIIDFLNRIKKYEAQYESITLHELASLKVKYFSITNVGESICFDCGKTHNHDNNCSIFNDLALELIYKFIVTYRINYGISYLLDVESFYKNGLYKPVKFIHHDTETKMVNKMINHHNHTTTTTTTQTQTTTTTILETDHDHNNTTITSNNI